MIATSLPATALLSDTSIHAFALTGGAASKVVVKQGESLQSIAEQYYGDRAEVRLVRAFNEMTQELDANGRESFVKADRVFLELAIHFRLRNELKSGELFVPKGNRFDDYREHLLAK